MTKASQCRRTQGLSLVEVVLAMAILAMAMVMLSQLVRLGLRAAGEARDVTRGQLLAESIMSEVAAGITPAESVQQVPVDLEPGWLVSIEVQTTMQDGLLQVVVVTERDSDSQNKARFQLSRWMRDPSLPLPTDDASLEEEGNANTFLDSSSSTRGSELQGGTS